MNGKKAKALRRVFGLDPHAARTYRRNRRGSITLSEGPRSQYQAVKRNKPLVDIMLRMHGA